MAGQLPDPHSLSSWEDAFQHPLPAVRKLEQQLRKNIDENRQKLRSLVGASYRDLLGTAERIIEMDEQMQTVETTLGEIGRRCNASTVERVAENHARMRKVVGEREGERFRAVAQTRVLQSVVKVVLRVVRGGGDALLGAKLVVLGRLLFKSVVENGHAPGVVEELRGRLAGARKKLLAYMERVVAKPSDDKAALANCLCAYTLLTSSTPKEVLRYFLKVRYQQLDSMSDAVTDESVMQMLELYSHTVIDSRELFPRRFGDALAQLAKAPLLQDEQVRSVTELNMDVYSSWIAADIKTFTPWVRHESLPSTDVTDALASWTRHAQTCVLEGLQEYLTSQDDARRVVSIRQKVVFKHLYVGGRLRNDSHTKATDDVRQAFLEKLKDVAGDAGTLTKLLEDEVEEGARGMTVAKQASLWDLATKNFDLAHGAVQFRQAVIDGRHGRTDSVGTAIRRLDSWISRIYAILDLAQEMRTSRWDNDVDFDMDDLDDHESLIDALNKKDPAAVTARLRDATAKSIDDLAERITALPTSSAHAAYRLRVWRETDRRRRVLGSRLDLPETPVELSELYRSISRSIIQTPIEQYVQAGQKASHVPVTLWDGTPRLPVQPSPATFRLLTGLHRAMEEVGGDLWSVEGVADMKRVVVGVLAEQLKDTQFVKAIEAPELTNGHSPSGEGEEERDPDNDDNDDSEHHGTLPNGVDHTSQAAADRDRLLQNTFELYYLRRVFCGDTSKSDSTGLDGLANGLRKRLELDDTVDERLRKSAGEYWKRTYLLFGLLSPAQW